MTTPGESPAPPPFVLDVSVLVAVARGDVEIIHLLQMMDVTGQPLVIPALAVMGASLAEPGGGAGVLLADLEKFGLAMAATVQGTREALALAALVTSGGLDPWDAHAALVASRPGRRILTLDAAKWRSHRHDLGEPVEFTEIANPPGEGS